MKPSNPYYQNRYQQKALGAPISRRDEAGHLIGINPWHRREQKNFSEMLQDWMIAVDCIPHSDNRKFLEKIQLTEVLSRGDLSKLLIGKYHPDPVLAQCLILAYAETIQDRSNRRAFRDQARMAGREGENNAIVLSRKKFDTYITQRLSVHRPWELITAEQHDDPILKQLIVILKRQSPTTPKSAITAGLRRLYHEDADIALEVISRALASEGGVSQEFLTRKNYGSGRKKH